MDAPEKTDFLGFVDEAVAVVTGAASGIGLATTRFLLGAGLHVVGIDVDGEGLARLRTEAEGRFVAEVADVGGHDRVHELFERIRTDVGPIGHLVNNAGPPSSRPLSIDEGLSLTAGSMQVTTAAWVATQPPEHASVVNVASVAGVVSGGPPPSLGVRSDASAANGWYAVGKAAIGGLTRYQAVSYGGRVRANAVAPGVVETPRLSDIVSGPYGQLLRERTPAGRLGQAVDVARAIVFLLSPAASYINGVVLVVDGGGTLVF